MRVGFLGLGTMGLPMAINLARRFHLTVWNRSTSKHQVMRQMGATVGKIPSHVVEQSDVIFTMLFDEHAIQSILSPEFRRALQNKTIVNTSSVSVEFSHYLANQIHQAGGNFIEMPVSGSRIPAEQGQLVGMMAGDAVIAERIRPIVEPITSAAIYCGGIGLGLKMKYTVNLFLITMTAGLAEAANLAQAQGIDLEKFGHVLEAGPMASTYSKLKLAKIVSEDWSAQASIIDCYNSTELIQAAAQTAHACSPLIRLSGALYKRANESGLGKEDMIAISKLLSMLSHQGSDEADSVMSDHINGSSSF